MNIWVDADACPKVIKEILFRAANRTKLPLTLIANQTLAVPPSPYIRSVQVSAGFDVADNEIVKRVNAGDLIGSEGNTGNAFALSSTGSLTVAGALDFETKSSYTLLVEVTDNGTGLLDLMEVPEPAVVNRE